MFQGNSNLCHRSEECILLELSEYNFELSLSSLKWMKLRYIQQQSIANYQNGFVVMYVRLVDELQVLTLTGYTFDELYYSLEYTSQAESFVGQATQYTSEKVRSWQSPSWMKLASGERATGEKWNRPGRGGTELIQGDNATIPRKHKKIGKNSTNVGG